MASRKVKVILMNELVVAVVLWNIRRWTVERCFVLGEKLADLSSWEESLVARPWRKVGSGIQVFS